MAESRDFRNSGLESIRGDLLKYLSASGACEDSPLPQIRQMLELAISIDGDGKNSPLAIHIHLYRIMEFECEGISPWEESIAILSNFLEIFEQFSGESARDDSRLFWRLDAAKFYASDDAFFFEPANMLAIIPLREICKAEIENRLG